MKNETAEQASPALNRGGVTGSPASSGNYNEERTARAEAFASDLRRRANHLLCEPEGYRAAIADCVRQAESDARRTPSPYRLSSFEWNPRLTAIIIVVLLILSTILWEGCRMTMAAPSAVGNYITAISTELSE